MEKGLKISDRASWHSLLSHQQSPEAISALHQKHREAKSDLNSTRILRTATSHWRETLPAGEKTTTRKTIEI